MITVLPHALAKAQQWEIAKGHLRALWAIDGAISSGEIDRPYRFEKSKDFIESFIKEFEELGFHEGFD